jgi:isopenicillin N synthase-like dioxygenase
MNKKLITLLYNIVILCGLFTTTFAAEFSENTPGSSNRFDISTIDFQDPDAATKLLKSFRETGFAAFTNHGINTTGLKEDWAAFFSLPEEEKMKHHFLKDPIGNGLGFYPYATEKAEGATDQNKMEYYHDKPGHILPDIIGARTKAYFSDAEKIKIQLSRWLDQAHAAEGFVLPKRLRDQGINSIEDMSEPNLHSNIVRILHYPASSENIGEVVNIAHTDISGVSLVIATEPGLEVCDRNGVWHKVGGNPDVLIVNAGDMLMWGTDGHITENGIKSTVHRVLRANGNERFSFPAFFGVKPWIQILPDETAGEAFHKRISGNLEKAEEAA